MTHHHHDQPGHEPITAAAAAQADPHAHAADYHPHVVSLPLLVGVFLALLFLTFVTVLVTWFELGEFNLIVALAIALIKGALVVLYFMHLRWDSLFNAIALIAGLGFAALFIAFCLLDTRETMPNVLEYPARPAMSPAGPATNPPSQP